MLFSFQYFLIAVLLFQPQSCSESDAIVCEVRSLMWQGDLDQARMLAERALETGDIDDATRIRLHLRLARIHDRYGLHLNTRPVPEAREHVAAAESIFSDSTRDLEGHLELAKARYAYWREMTDREFPETIRHAETALELLRQAGDRHGEADALHRLGLAYLQRRDLVQARDYFDQSLQVDSLAGPRPIMLGDYERHVGYLYVIEGDTESAVPYFERSLEVRRQGGLTDQSLFAATTYASALVDIGRAREAHQPLLYAFMLAEKLNSPVGKSRAGVVLGEMYEQLGLEAAAVEAYEMTRRVATSVGYGSVERQAVEGLARLNPGDR
jgi:tetratricopeptide (TPR) repeat protein